MSRWFVALGLLFASPLAADPRPGDRAAADAKVVESDVGVIIGGHFGVDHIGPKAHAEIVRRARARPVIYLAALEKIAVAATDDARASTFVTFGIELLKPGATKEAVALATKLLPIYERAAKQPSPSKDPSRAKRLAERVAHLRALAK